MGWKKKVGIAVGGLILLLAAALGAAIYFGWLIPPVQVAEPGPTGRRIASNGLLANYFPGRGAARGRPSCFSAARRADCRNPDAASRSRSRRRASRCFSCLITAAPTSRPTWS